MVKSSCYQRGSVGDEYYLGWLAEPITLNLLGNLTHWRIVMNTLTLPLNFSSSSRELFLKAQCCVISPKGSKFSICIWFKSMHTPVVQNQCNSITVAMISVPEGQHGMRQRVKEAQTFFFHQKGWEGFNVKREYASWSWFCISSARSSTGAQITVLGNQTAKGRSAKAASHSQTRRVVTSSQLHCREQKPSAYRLISFDPQFFFLSVHFSSL